MKKQLEKYSVNLIRINEMKISGKGDADAWAKATLLDEFISPWDIQKPSRIEFRALWDKVNLYFCFTVYDSKIHIEEKDSSLASIGNSDRVELFFRTNGLLNPYYCLEMDATARVMDFKAYPNKNFDFDWYWPKMDLEVQSFISERGFTLEGAISIASLESLNLIKDNKIETGIFRAKYYKKENSNFEPVWITWVNPDTKLPNFHIASSFGELELVD